MYRKMRPTGTFQISIYWATSRRRFWSLNLPSITDVTSNITSESLCTVAGAVITNKLLA